jgi:subtilisin family serine protease
VVKGEKQPNSDTVTYKSKLGGDITYTRTKDTLKNAVSGVSIESISHSLNLLRLRATSRIARFLRTVAGLSAPAHGALKKLPLAAPVEISSRLSEVSTRADENIARHLESKRANEAVLDTIQVYKDKYGNDRYLSTKEFIVKFNDEVNDQDARKILADTRSSIISHHERIPGLYVANKPDDMELFDIIQALNETDGVAFCEPSEFGKDDRLSNGNIACKISDMSRFWALHLIEATDVLGSGTATENVIIAIVDTGVDLEHENLKPNLLARNGEDWDFADADNIPLDEGESDYHGTFIAGIAAAADKKDGMIGLCPKAKIMPLRVDLISDANRRSKYFDRFEAIMYVAERARKNENKRFVLTCSWKTSGNYEIIGWAMQKALDSGVIVVCAAGNDNRNLNRRPLWPAEYEGVITVAATDQGDRKWKDSNYGDRVDVCAPGANVWSTSGNERCKYRFGSGTSFAVPYVAGLAALLWSVKPSFSNNQIREIIKSTCDNIDSCNKARYRKLLGHGRINVRKAIAKVHTS